MSLSELFRDARVAKGLSQEALAREVNLSVSTVLRIEGGKLMPLAPTLFAIARVLDVDPALVSDAVLQPA